LEFYTGATVPLPRRVEWASTRSAKETPVLEEMGKKQTSRRSKNSLPDDSLPLESGYKTQEGTRRTALVASLVALFVVGNAIPIDAFIGGAGFITGGIILLPVIARLVKPMEAVVVAALASVVLFVLQLSVIPVFGYFGMLVPATGIVLGSVGFHKSYLYPMSYVVFGAIWYLLFSHGTLFWLLPYFIVIAMTMANQIRPFEPGKRLNVALHCLDTTICELVTLNIGSISLLHLPGELWTIITPFMLLERALAVVGASSILLALIRVKNVLKLEYI
jgi:hypothetical protein